MLITFSMSKEYEFIAPGHDFAPRLTAKELANSINIILRTMYNAKRVYEAGPVVDTRAMTM